MEALVFDFLPQIPTANRIETAPLVQTLAQIRFSPAGTLAEHSVATMFQRRLIKRYPRLLPEVQAVFTGMPGEVKPETMKQYRLTDVGNSWACVIGSQHLTIETSAYATWPDMRERIEEALAVLEDIDCPVVRERIGLRYINHIPANADGSFVGRVNPDLLQPFTSKIWRDSLVASIGQAVFSDGSAQMAVRYGTGRAVENMPADAWLLDIDCSDEVAAEFDLAASIDYFDALNDAAIRCFVELVGAAYSVAVTGGN
jgi:uncharacterized protein (TIGR04255 family)